MLYNYLTVAVRQLLKNKIYLLINMVGMGVAIASAMTAYLLVAYNIEFDSSVDQDKVKNVVKVLHHRKDADGDLFKELVAPVPLGPAVMDDISGIVRFSRFCSDGGYLSVAANGFHETIFFADKDFMDMFEPRIVSGSKKSFLDKNSIFLTEKFAHKYFGHENALGKTMVVSINNVPLNVMVGGILADVPYNSTFTENILMRIENYLDIYDIRENDWASAHNASTLFELSDIAHANAIARQFNKYTTLRNTAVPDSHSSHYELMPFNRYVSPNDVRRSDLHLPIPFIALGTFMSLAGIILLIACFNLTNTTLALYTKRMKEIGVRKVSGSSRLQIASQFFIEISLTIMLSVAVGFAMSLYIIPHFAAMWELPYGLKELNSINIIVTLMILLFSSAVLAGIYPAAFGSRQSPLILFRSGKMAGGTNLFIRLLLVSQFSLSIMVLIGGTAFTQNATYQNNISFGYDKDMLLTALVQGRHEAEALSHALSDHPKIERTSPAVHHFAFINAGESPAQLGPQKFHASVYEVGQEYFRTVGLSLISGRFFNDRDTLQYYIIVDENFVRRKQLSAPLDTKIVLDGKSFTIIGVVSNHLTDLESHDRENYIYKLAKPDQYQILVIRAEASTLSETQRYVQQQWKKLFPDKPLRTDLQRDILYQEANMYNRNLSRIFFFITILGCVLSVSGLYSMASLNISRRTKEIGVRKVLGASVMNILNLINVEFALILLAAFVLGGWGGYTLTSALLADLYGQHLSVSIVTVILSGLLVFTVGITATSLTIWSTANSNPVKSLREC